MTIYRQLTVSEYIDELGYELDSAIDDCFWRGGYTELLERFVTQSALNDGVQLTDLENLEDQVWAAYTVAEKGLS